MKPEDQIKALAELDGWTKHKHYDFDYPAWIPAGFNYDSDSSKGIYASPYNLIKLEHELPQWPTSYDAIIPLINKLWSDEKFVQGFGCACMMVKERTGKISVIQFTTGELCEALLRATRKWVV